MKEDVRMVLQKKAEQVAYATEILLSKTRDWQVIKQYLSNRLEEMQLTEEQQMKLDRYQFIYNQLVSNKYTEQEILSQLTNKSFYGLSIRQAYEDMDATREIFSSVVNINKRFELQLELQAAKQMKLKCIEMGDMKTAAVIQKNIIAIASLLPDIEENPAELFEGHTIEATFDPALLGAPPVNMKEVLDAINAKRNKKIKIDMFEDLPFEDSKEGDGN